MVIDDAVGSRRCTIASARKAQLGVVQSPCVARVVKAVNEVGVHVFVVTGGVVAHRVEYHRRMVLRPRAVELSVPA